VVVAHKTKQEKVIGLEALNQVIQEEERQIKKEILQGALQVSASGRDKLFRIYNFVYGVGVEAFCAADGNPTDLTSSSEGNGECY
jgi:hypothetical protein